MVVPTSPFTLRYFDWLRGLDNQGHVVSRRLGRIWAPLQGETFPFSVSLWATGDEDRFELIVWGYDWPTSGS